MAVTLVEADVYAPGSSSGSVSFTIGAVPAAGSLLVANVSYSQYSATRTCTPPSGWLLLGTLSQNNASQSVFWKIAGASEPTAVVFTINGASQDWCSGELLVLTGTGASAPAFAQLGANGSAPTSPSLAPSATGALPIAFFAQDASSFSGAQIVGATGWTTAIANVSYHMSTAATMAPLGTTAAQQCVAQSSSGVAADYAAAILFAAPLVVAAGGATGNAGNASGAIGSGRNPSGAVGNG